MRWIAIPILASLLLAGGGVSPRANPSDYPAQAKITGATIAAIVLTPEQVRKIFPAEISRKYLVIEVALYPAGVFDLDPYDFRLKGPDGDLVRPETPRQVASIWKEKDPELPGKVRVTNEEDVVVATGRDPVTGQRRTAVGTYSGVAVSNGDDPRTQPPAPSASKPDPYAIEAKLHDLALPEGKTRDAVAGYLYFPKPGKKSKSVGLKYNATGASADLTLPVK